MYCPHLHKSISPMQVWNNNIGRENKGYLGCLLINATSQSRLIDPVASLSVSATFNTWDLLSHKHNMFLNFFLK